MSDVYYDLVPGDVDVAQVLQDASVNKVIR